MTYSKLGDKDAEQGENLGLSSLWHVLLVVEEDGVEEWRHDAVEDEFGIAVLRNERGQQNQDLAFDGTHRLDERVFESLFSGCGHSAGDLLGKDSEIRLFSSDFPEL